MSTPTVPGEKAGFKRNDVIVAMRDWPIDDEASLRFRLATTLRSATRCRSR